MARQKGLTNHFTPTKGFVTEFTPTQFPTDAAIDVDNCVFDVDGSVRRRPGLNFETSYRLNLVNGAVIAEPELDTIARTVGLWTNVANSGTLNIVVVQLGEFLQFYAQIGSISANFLGELDLTPYATEVALLRTSQVVGASAVGDFYLTGEHINPILIAYDGVSFTVEQRDLQIRDFEGVEDNLAINERPTTLGINHYYNLRNQGWTIENINLFAGLAADFNLETAVQGTGATAAAGKDFPSNADIMYTGFSTDSSGNPIFDPDVIRENNYFGNTPAPKGHFILKAFEQDRDEALGIAGVGEVLIPNRPEAIAFHNGRVFYSKPSTQQLVTGIYFSQVLNMVGTANKLYASADPTAQEINEVVATDGGFIPTPSIGRILKLVEMGNGVLIGATNGVWYLTGAGDGEGFSATSNRILKVSDAGLLGQDGYVESEDAGYFWSSDGIIGLGLNDLGVPQAANVSDRTIQQFYINISSASKRNAKGIYVPEQRKVYWGYLEATAAETTNTQDIDTVLVFDLTIGGFYKYSLATQSGYPRVLGFSRVASLAEDTNNENVTTESGEQVYLTDGITPVQIDALSRVAQITQLKLLTAVNSVTEGGWVTTFSEFNDRTFHDWRYYDPAGVGLNYTSFIEFGYNTFGTNHTRGGATYVHSFFSTRSKNLAAGGYYELPPKYGFSQGTNFTQSVFEVLHFQPSDMQATQSVMEVLHA